MGFRTKPAADVVTQHSQRDSAYLETNRKPRSRISNGDHKAWNASEVSKLHEPGGKAVISIPALGQQQSHPFLGEAARIDLPCFTA